MNFRLDDDHARIRDTVRRFAERDVAPRGAELDASGEFPYDLVRAAAELGVMGLPFPVETGGAGAGMLGFCVALEELARADMSLAATVMVSVATGLVIHEYGTAAQRARFMPRLMAGDGLGATAGTEPSAGSDTEAFRTSARREGTDWVLNGQKAFITNAGTKVTDVILTVAVTGARPDGRKEFSIFAVPAGSPGVVVGLPYRKMGWRSSDTRPVFFEDCRVAGDSLIGRAGQGRFLLHKGYARGRVCLAAMSVGLGQACLDSSLRYATERQAFGRPLGRLQMIQDMVAEMSVQLDAARLLTYRAAWYVDQGEPSLRATATAKYFATEAAKRIADLAVQLHGGMGYMDECAVSRYYRDIRVATIADGSSQIQKLIIGRELGLGAAFSG